MSSNTKRQSNFDSNHIYVGRVKWFNNKSGYGFITSCDEKNKDEDVFVHHSSIQMEGFKTLKEGQRVTMEVSQGEKGPQADSVSVD